jgi:hypothetical protein
MIPITSFLAFVFSLACFTIGHWLDSYPVMIFFAVAAIISMLLKLANHGRKIFMLNAAEHQSYWLVYRQSGHRQFDRKNSQPHSGRRLVRQQGTDQ